MNKSRQSYSGCLSHLYVKAMLTVLLLTVSSFQMKAADSIGNEKVTIEQNNVPVKLILKQIEKQCKVHFFYNVQQVDVKRAVSLHIKDETVQDALHKIFNGTNTNFKFSGRQVLLFRTTSAGAQSATYDETIMPSNISLLTFAVSGLITDEQNQPLPGVTILEKGTTNGTTSDSNGQFKIDVADGNATLVFSFIGYATQETLINNQTVINISLAPDVFSLQEVVVVGYGEQKKVNVTGAVSAIDSKQIENRSVTNLSSALTGLSSGMYVRQSSGRPGDDGASIRIRGLGTLNDNSALVIIDGIQGVMDAVNPDDVESISVLKDAASASIYGSRAANGVILITTKKGSKDKISINYTGILSGASPSRLPSFVSNYARHMRLTNEGFTNLGQSAAYTDATIEAWETASLNPNGTNSIGVPNYIAYPNTDWGDVIFENKMLQNHNVSVNGGNDKTQYLFSAGYLYNPGVMANTYQERYQMRINLQTKIAKFLTIGTQTFGQTRTEGLGNTDNAFNALYQTTPGVYPYLDGKYGWPEAPEESSTANNILTYLYNVGGDDVESRFNTTLFANVDIAPGLKFETKVNYQIRFAEYNSHSNPYEKWSFATNTLKQAATPADQLSTYYSFNKNRQTTIDNVLRYNNVFAKNHDVGILVGYNQYYYNYYNFNATKLGLLDESITTLGSATTVTSAGGGEYDYAMQSYFGRLNYAYKDRYIIEGVLRYDGSSKFASDKRWGWFPAFSAGWRISEEPFMQRFNNYVENLKVRASYGITGNNVLSDDASKGNYDYQSAYSTTNYSFNGSAETGLAVTKMANSDLKWERTTTTDVGLEGTTLHGKVNFEVDWYRKYTDGILYTPTIPLTTGTATAATQNIAEVVNRGLEVTLGFRGSRRDFSYSISGNFAYNFNRITKYKGTFSEGWTTGSDGTLTYSSNLGNVSSGTDTRVLEGHTINEHYLYNLYSGDGSYFNSRGDVNINGGPKDGMIRTPDDLEWVQNMLTAGYKFQPGGSVSKSAIYYGDFIYADTNGDGNYGNSYDKSFTGKSSTPRFNFGLQTNFSFKGIDLSMIWSGSTGMWYYWNARGYVGSIVQLGYAISEMVANDHYYYNADNPSDASNNIQGKYPRLKNSTDAQNNLSSTFYLHNASYIKLKNLQLGYTVPKSISKKAGLEKARVYFSAENLLMITKYPLLDPEVGAGINYPTMRQLSLGVNIVF